MAQLTFDFQKVLDADGIGISMTGMAIVFVALGLISTVIALLPKVLTMLAPFLPPETEPHTHLAAAPTAKPAAENDAVVAAIGFVLLSRRDRQA
jgi:oxaloacetate decarboxylase gamma subunit